MMTKVVGSFNGIASKAKIMSSASGTVFTMLLRDRARSSCSPDSITVTPGKSGL